MTNVTVTEWVIAAVMLGVAAFVGRPLRSGLGIRLRAAVEWLLLEDWYPGFLGGRKQVTPTGRWGTTLALALIVMFTCQYKARSSTSPM